MGKLADEITAMEAKNPYDRELIFSKFLKEHGENYSQEDFILFLRKRYEAINLISAPPEIIKTWDY